MRLLSFIFILALLSFSDGRSVHGISKRRMYVRVPFMHSINSNQLSWIMNNKDKVKKFAQPQLSQEMDAE